MDGCLIHLLSKWHSLFCFFAAGAALAILRSALAEFAAVGRVRVPRVCATPSQQSAQSRIMFVTRMRRREVGGDNARKLSQNCELLSERTKWRVEALASL